MRRGLAVAAVLAASLIVFTSYTVLSPPHRVYLVLHGLPRGVAAVYIEAVKPRGPIPFYAAAYQVPESGTVVAELPWPRLHALAEKWHSLRPGLNEFGLVIHLVVVDPKARKVSLQAIDSISVPIDHVLPGRPLIIEASVKKLSDTAARLTSVKTRQPNPWELLTLKPTKRVDKEVHIEEKHSQLTGSAPEPPLENGAPPAHRVCELIGDPITLMFLTKICWDPIVYVAPENIAYIYGDQPGAVKYWNGTLYVQTPLAVVYNCCSASGVLTAAIGLEAQAQSYRIYPSFGIDLGSLIKAVKKHIRIPLPSLEIWRGSGPTWGSGKYTVYVSAPVLPDKYVTFYIYARPFYVIYNVTVDFILPPAGRDTRIEAAALVSDVLLEPGSGSVKYIEAGFYEGTPPKELMDAMLHGGELAYAVTLKPKEGRMLKYILANVVGTCGVSFGISIPVGAAAAGIVCSALTGIPVADVFTAPECIALIAVASNFQVSFVAEPGEIKVAGGLTNDGEWHGVGYNIDEYVYIEQSIYEYDLDGCSARVPIGIYIESR